MPVVAIINQKGGVGKTNIATNLASAMSQDRYTILLDSDPQRSAACWAAINRRPRLMLVVRGVEPGSLAKEAKESNKEHDWTIIDCPPGINPISVDAIRAAHVVLIPCKPRAWDLWACEDIVKAVKLRQDANRGWPKAAFVISMDKPRTRFSQTTRTVLERFDIPLMQSRTTEREAYAWAAAEGKSVLTGGDRVAKQEIIDLRQEVRELCNGIPT